MKGSSGMRPAKRLVMFLWMAGVGLLTLYGIAKGDAAIGSRIDIARVEAARAPDVSRWSEARVRAYHASESADAGPLLGTLVISRANLKAPLYADSSELHLNRGVGLIEGTARPGTHGNVGVAGHRDGFFRALQDVRIGDVIEVRTPASEYSYRITNLSIVGADDARLLAPTSQSVVTLVTCYPFYFVGNAPKRFVVRGALISSQEFGT
jgi:sortase A